MPDFDRHGKLHHRTVRQPSLGFLDPSKLTKKLGHLSNDFVTIFFVIEIVTKTVKLFICFF
jgi:hypothetical protein